MKLPLTLTVKADDLITRDVIKERDKLAARGQNITAIGSSDDNQSAAIVVRDIRKYVKEVAEARKSLTKPLDEATTLLINIERDHLAPLIEEQKRLERAGTAWLELEQKRVEAEEKKRREEFEAAQREQFRLADEARNAPNKVQEMIANRKLEVAKNQVQSVIAAPTPQLTKAQGQTMKRVLKYEVTDIYALVKARPDLCKIEAKASAINSTCNPDFPVPGLRLYWENQSTYTTR